MGTKPDNNSAEKKIDQVEPEPWNNFSQLNQKSSETVNTVTNTEKTTSLATRSSLREQKRKTNLQKTEKIQLNLDKSQHSKRIISYKIIAIIGIIGIIFYGIIYSDSKNVPLLNFDSTRNPPPNISHIAQNEIYLETQQLVAATEKQILDSSSHDFSAALRIYQAHLDALKTSRNNTGEFVESYPATLKEMFILNLDSAQNSIDFSYEVDSRLTALFASIGFSRYFLAQDIAKKIPDENLEIDIKLAPYNITPHSIEIQHSTESIVAALKDILVTELEIVYVYETIAINLNVAEQDIALSFAQQHINSVQENQKILADIDYEYPLFHGGYSVNSAQKDSISTKQKLADMESFLSEKYLKLAEISIEEYRKYAINNTYQILKRHAYWDSNLQIFPGIK